MLVQGQKPSVFAGTVVMHLAGAGVGFDESVAGWDIIRFLRATAKIIIAQPQLRQPAIDPVCMDMRAIM